MLQPNMNKKETQEVKGSHSVSVFFSYCWQTNRKLGGGGGIVAALCPQWNDNPPQSDVIPPQSDVIIIINKKLWGYHL